MYRCNSCKTISADADVRMLYDGSTRVYCRECGSDMVDASSEESCHSCGCILFDNDTAYEAGGEVYCTGCVELVTVQSAT